jgi:hypothetical protein
LVSASGVFITVAKERMICPFSNRLCEECALYRGRHYYLCFCQKYRGYLGKPGEVTKEDSLLVPGARSSGEFEMPSIIRTSAIDPFVADRESHKKEV